MTAPNVTSTAWGTFTSYLPNTALPSWDATTKFVTNMDYSSAWHTIRDNGASLLTTAPSYLLAAFTGAALWSNREWLLSKLNPFKTTPAAPQPAEVVQTAEAKVEETAKLEASKSNSSAASDDEASAEASQEASKEEVEASVDASASSSEDEAAKTEVEAPKVAEAAIEAAPSRFWVPNFLRAKTPEKAPAPVQGTPAVVTVPVVADTKSVPAAKVPVTKVKAEPATKTRAPSQRRSPAKAR